MQGGYPDGKNDMRKNISFIKPALATILSIILLGEKIAPNILIGIVFVVVV